MTDLCKYVGDYLRTYRRYKGLTLNAGALEAGIAHSNLHYIETRGTAQVKTLHKIAKSYGLVLSVVFEFAEAAEQLGLVAAYAKEAPHLLSFHKPVKQK